MPGRAEGDTLSGCQWGQVSMELGLLQAGKAARRGSSFQILLQTRCAHEAPAPLGFFSQTHLIMIAGLGNKVLFNSKSIWQPVRAQSAGCQSQWLPRRPSALAAQGPEALAQHSSPWYPAVPYELTCHWCHWSPHAKAGDKRIGDFSPLYLEVVS